MFSNHTKTFYKYLFSYISLLLVGMIFFVFFIQGYLIQILKKEIMKSHIIALEQTAMSIDTEIKQLYQIDYQITSSNDNFLSYFLMEDTPSRDRKIVDELHNYISTSSFISDIAMISEQSDFIYTSSGSYPVELFFNSIYHYANWNTPPTDIYNIKNRMIRQSELINEKEKYITFINPPSTYSNFPTYTILYWVKENQLLNILAHLNNESTITLILNEKGEPVLTPDARITPEVFANILSSIEDNKNQYTSIKIEKSPYYLFTIPSHTSNWKYVTLLSTAKAAQPILSIQLIFGAILFLAFLFGFITIMIYMRMTYLPLKNLKIFSDVFLGGEEHDEIESLRDAIFYLSDQNKLINNTIQSVQSLRDSLLFSLLKGKISTIEEFNNSGNAIQMQFTKTNYQVLIFSLSNKEKADVLNRDFLETVFSSIFNDTIEYYFRDLFETNQYVMVISTDSPDMTELSNYYNRLLTVLEEEYEIIFTLGVGIITSDFHKIPTSYFESSLALKESFIKGSGTLILFSDLNNNLEEFIYPFREIENIKLTIQSMNYEKLPKDLELFFQKLESSFVRSEYARMLCNHLAYLFLSAKDLPARNTEHLLPLLYSDSYETYKQTLYTMIAELKQNIAIQDIEHLPLCEQIRRYIHDNYDNCNFSVQDAAAALGINSSYMSQLFKQQNNITLIEYTTALRIKKAYSLLKETNMPLNMVAEEVGYYNLNSFIRRFKQITGITPGEYRKTEDTYG